ncbi:MULTISPECIES: hypothetical protein [unclassified Halomonas]|uniref:hypothetical protein n=1 Tax=unclassified Halomonas TaxID=2609666 RepID=UPI0020A0DEB0|nr:MULTISPECIES: hypothetical protein [unclassified Halomonas]MCP1314397.1 hypothetical protein [Halomonas sp. 707D7]MCP1328441.1 hypothetical protein [Halomonas sp. 707D4]
MPIYVPDELVLQPINAGDQVAFITKFNNTQAAFALFAEQCALMVKSIEGAFDDAIQEAQGAAQQSGESAQASSQSAAEAERYKNEAQQIAIGNVAITDLRPGALTEPGDYVSVDDEGELAKRNLAVDVNTQLTSGEQSASLSRSDVASGVATDTLDLAERQVFRVDASTPRTLDLVGSPGADRAIVVIVHVSGQEAVTWPDSIVWDEGLAPALDSEFTRVALIWDGVEWSGNGRARV